MLKKLYKIELLKLLPLGAFKAILIIHFALYILVLTLSTQINIQIPGLDFSKIYSFPNIWNLSTWLASWFNILLTLLMIIFIGNEFSQKTFRQAVIDGLKREELIYGKSIVIIILSLYTFVLVFLSTIVMGLFTTDQINFADIFNKSYYILIYFIQAIGYLTIGMFFIVLFKNTGLSILFFILYFFPVEPMIRLFLPDSVSAFFPMKILSNLTPAPGFDSISDDKFMTQNFNMPQNAHIAETSYNWTNLAVAISYIAVFWFISYLLIKKRDL